MANNSNVFTIRGRLDWAKVIGEPRLNRFTEEREWSVDVTPNAAGLKTLKQIGITDKLKDPKEGDPRKDQFITFRVKEFREDRKTGERKANRPIRIITAAGTEWDGSLLGNGTIADIKFKVSDKVAGRPRGAYIQAIRVLDHVSFEQEDFEPLSEDDEYFASAAKPATAKAKESGAFDTEDDDFEEDEIPF